MPICSIIAIGNEITRGKIIDSNSAFIATKLFNAGFSQTQISAVGDTLESIKSELLFRANTSDILITTGGLGPTSDDLTREAIAATASVGLKLDDNALTKLTEFCAKRNREVNENNRRQVFFPEGATVYPNAMGTADGFLTPLILSSGKNAGKIVPVFSLPGIPKEMKYLVENFVLPWIRHEFSTLASPITETLRCFGLPESQIGEIIESCQLDSRIDVSYRPMFPEILLQFFVSGTEPNANSIAKSASDKVLNAIGPEFIVSSSESKTMLETVAELLTTKNLTISVAESCSGGLLADAFVSQSGASAFFYGSVVCYSNEAKSNYLGVSPELIAKHGAVSSEVAEAMAKRCREVSKTDIALSVTGVAGPDGGSPEKPVGTVWVGISAPTTSKAVKLSLPWDREYNRKYSVTKGLDLVRRYLLGLDLD